MKIRTSIRAGGQGCSPETLNYMQKAVNMQNKVENCFQQGNVSPQPPVYGYYPYNYYGSTPPTTTTSPYYTGSTTYPDMSGVCG
jgi:hypothetical protein